MKKLSNYVKNGKGRGLKLVAIFILVCALGLTALTYHATNEFFKNPVTQKFFDSIPTVEIKDHIAQNTDVKWMGILPLPDIPITVAIDTSIENITLPTPAVFYVTKNALFVVNQQTQDVRVLELPKEVTISPDSIRTFYKFWIVAVTVISLFAVMITAWLSYLATVLVTTFAAWLFRIVRNGGRIWRLTSLTWVFAIIASFISTLLGLTLTTSLVLLAVIIINLIILSRFEN